METKTKYTHRYLARIVIETLTPLAVGSGEKDIITDALVATDVNRLPYIPGTSIAGVLRSMLESLADSNMGITADDIRNIFGFQDKNKGKGSEIIFSEAKIMGATGRVVDGLDRKAIGSDDLLKHYQMLPVRKHVRIDGKGVAEKYGLFDEQVVFAGSRFCFEMEMVSDGTNFAQFESVLRQLYSVDFRIGGGTRCGFGKIRVVDMQLMNLNLGKKADLDLYLNKTSALDSDFWANNEKRVSRSSSEEIPSVVNTCYRLTLTPDSFFLFGSGCADDEADMTPVTARRVEWTEAKDDNGKKVTNGKILENLVLIPATSLKGALSHRVAFHWNRMQGIYADDIKPDALKDYTATANGAVRLLFGASGDGPESVITRGNVLFEDIIGGPISAKMFNHVAIDRFTGGGIEGALFSESTAYGKDESYTTNIVIDNSALLKACKKEWGEEKASDLMKKLDKAFTAALNDLCDGMLPLGGGVNRGHGIFTGYYEKIKNEYGADI